MGGVGGVASTQYIFKFARKLVKKVCQVAIGLATVFSVSFCVFSNNIVTIVGQLVRTPPPPTEGVSSYHCLHPAANAGLEEH